MVSLTELASRCIQRLYFIPALVVLLASGLYMSPTVQADTTLKVAHAASTGNTGHKAMEHLAGLLEDRTDGRITMKIFPSAQMGSEREVIESIQLGNLDVTFVSSAVLGPFDSEFYALDIPFLFKDRDTAYRVLDGEVGQQLLNSLDQVGLKGLGYWENGFRQLTNDIQPIHSPEDLKGVKMRTMENPIHLEFWELAGANPSPLAFGELFTALQQGTFDAQEGPINLFYDMKFNEVQDYITKTNHIYSAWPIVINPDVYSSFSDKDREIFDQAMQEATEFQRQLAKEADEKAVESMPDVEVTELTSEQRAEFVNLMEPALEMVKERAGAQLVDDLISAASDGQ